MADIATTPVRAPPSALPLAVVPAGAVLTAIFLSLTLTAERGAVSILMAQHLLVMSVIAPLLALVLPAAGPRAALWPAAIVQMALLWGWHAPSVQAAAAASPLAHAVMSFALLLASIAFWRSVLALAGAGRWSAIGALLLTGKLACLLGALLIFARRDLYDLAGVPLAFCLSRPSSLADQQLAGLVMVIACPLSYLVAGAMLAGRAIFDLERRS